MAAHVSHAHIECPGMSSARLARLPRIRVAQIVMNYPFHGWSPDEICNQYPHLLPAEVHSAMAYYFDHQSEFEEEIAEDIRDAEEWRQTTPESPIIARMRIAKLANTRSRESN